MIVEMAETCHGMNVIKSETVFKMFGLQYWNVYSSISDQNAYQCLTFIMFIGFIGFKDAFESESKRLCSVLKQHSYKVVL